MLRKTLFPALVATLAGLLLNSQVYGWGAYHAGYTHVGPNGAYHVGETAVGGYGGGAAYGGAYHVGYAEGGAYGGAYHAGYAYGGGVNAGGYHYTPSYSFNNYSAGYHP
jgi:hypothetical protein